MMPPAVSYAVVGSAEAAVSQDDVTVTPVTVPPPASSASVHRLIMMPPAVSYAVVGSAEAAVSQDDVTVTPVTVVTPPASSACRRAAGACLSVALLVAAGAYVAFVMQRVHAAVDDDDGSK